MSTIIEDVFQIVVRDADGKKFEKVSRFNLTSEYFEFDAQLDVNVDIYPLHEGDKVTLALAHTLALDGTKDESYSFDQSGQPSLADKYEYVMFGMRLSETSRRLKLSE
ncbi:hypothetical protein CYMTET_34977 [Cymbomonas tetramitiformis]|uniref:Uncharacterized protein n=1 Tax=Cymbomonas tetramitiformis TaxID=36881 RepID=A0AAE0FA53_9CHLO|nr:hypothetical protein CYMTET_34977 [Cymbomonas tetramitiformis]